MIDSKVMRAHLEKYEGNFPFMYLDSKNYVTIGVGHLLRKPEAAQDLPFIYRKDHVEMKDGKGVVTAQKGKVATRDQIAAEHAHVESFANQNLAAKAFETRTELGLTSDEIDSLFAKDISSFVKSLGRLFPEIDQYPQGAQLALLDMIYNTGATGLRRKTPLVKAVQAKNWETAAKSCHRSNVNKQRNEDTAALFRSAIAVENQKKAKDPGTPKGRPRNVSSPFESTPSGGLTAPLIRQRSVPPR